MVNILIPAIIITISGIKKKKIKNLSIAIIFIIIGSFVALKGEIDNFSAISLFFVSWFIIKNKIYCIASALILLILTILKFSVNELPIPNFVNMLNAYIMMGYVFYYLFWPITEIRSDKDLNRGLSFEQIETVKMLMKGYKHHQAAKELNIERSSYSARVSSLRDRYGAISDFQLALALREDGVIGEDDFTMVKLIQRTDTNK